MNDPLNPYRPPASDATEEPTGDTLPGLRGLLIALAIIASWLVLRFFVGWTAVAVVLGGATTVSATHGFAKGLRGLNAHPPPRAGKLLTLVVVGANGLVGAVGGLFTLVSLAVGFGSCSGYTH